MGAAEGAFELGWSVLIATWVLFIVKDSVNMERFEANFHLLRRWLCIRQRGDSLSSWLEDNLVQSVAIYGLGAVGELLEEELSQAGIVVCYAIDKAAQDKKRSYPIYDTEQDIYPEADVLIVSTVSIYWEVVERMRSKITIPIVSLDDIVSYCYSGRLA